MKKNQRRIMVFSKRKKLRSIIFIIKTVSIMSLILGCNIFTPIKNSPPEITIETTVNGRVGENFLIKCSIEDKNGVEDIIYVKLNIDDGNDGIWDKVVESNSYSGPIEFNVVPHCAGSLKVEVTAQDKGGNETVAEKEAPVSDIDAPDLSGVNCGSIEGQEVVISLPAISNGEYTGVEATNGGANLVKLLLDATNNTLTIKPSDNISEKTSYDLKFNYRSTATGNVGSIAKTENVLENLCRVQGRLETSSDPGELQSGEARMYNEETMASEDDYIAKQDVSDGVIDFKANTPADKVSLQGFVKDKNSFWAKISLDGTKDYLITNGNLIFDSSGDVTNYGQATVRTNYYANSINAAKQRAIFEKTNSRTEIAPDNIPYGQITPDIENLKVIEILRKNPYSGVVYTAEQQEAIAEVFRNNEAVKKAFRGKDLSTIIQIDGEDNLPPAGCINNFTYSDVVNPSINCYTIVPSNSITTAMTVKYFQNNTALSGIVNRLRVEINPSKVPSSVSVNLAAYIMHEVIGHGDFAYWSHVPDEYGFDSIAATCTSLKTLGGIDYACIDAARSRTFPLRSPSYKTHGLKAGPYD